jgi:hypothetical protein
VVSHAHHFNSQHPCRRGGSAVRRTRSQRPATRALNASAPGIQAPTDAPYWGRQHKLGHYALEEPGSGKRASGRHVEQAAAEAGVRALVQGVPVAESGAQHAPMQTTAAPMQNSFRKRRSSGPIGALRTSPAITAEACASRWEAVVATSYWRGAGRGVVVLELDVVHKRVEAEGSARSALRDRALRDPFVEIVGERARVACPHIGRDGVVDGLLEDRAQPLAVCDG